MLIRHIEDQLVIVRQTDHMAQVARIAERWGNRRFPAPEHREETLRAAGLHDAGWRIWEERPTLLPETGRPRNLGEVEPEVHAAFYSAGVEAAIAVDPYSGLLVSLHASVLYAGVEGWNPRTLAPPALPESQGLGRRFLAGQSALQRSLRDRLAQSTRFAGAVEPDRLWPAYLRLRAWDRLSLFFVLHNMVSREIDHIPTIDGETTIAVRQIDEHEATADPWPFDRGHVHVPVVVTKLADKRYHDDEQFLATLLAAKPEVWDYSLRAPC